MAASQVTRGRREGRRGHGLGVDVEVLVDLRTTPGAARAPGATLRRLHGCEIAWGLCAEEECAHRFRPWPASCRVCGRPCLRSQSAPGVSVSQVRERASIVVMSLRFSLSFSEDRRMRCSSASMSVNRRRTSTDALPRSAARCKRVRRLRVRGNVCSSGPSPRCPASVWRRPG